MVGLPAARGHGVERAGRELHAPARPVHGPVEGRGRASSASIRPRASSARSSQPQPGVRAGQGVEQQQARTLRRGTAPSRSRSTRARSLTAAPTLAGVQACAGPQGRRARGPHRRPALQRGPLEQVAGLDDVRSGPGRHPRQQGPAEQGEQDGPAVTPALESGERVVEAGQGLGGSANRPQATSASTSASGADADEAAPVPSSGQPRTLGTLPSRTDRAARA